MQLTPQDYAAWAAATGNAYPSTSQERAQAAPAVMQWKAAQGAAQQPQQDDNRNVLATAGAIGAIAAGVGAGGYGLLRLLNQKGQGPVDDAGLTAQQQSQSPPPPPVGGNTGPVGGGSGGSGGAAAPVPTSAGGGVAATPVPRAGFPYASGRELGLPVVFTDQGILDLGNSVNAVKQGESPLQDPDIGPLLAAGDFKTAYKFARVKALTGVEGAETLLANTERYINAQATPGGPIAKVITVPNRDAVVRYASPSDQAQNIEGPPIELVSNADAYKIGDIAVVDQAQYGNNGEKITGKPVILEKWQLRQGASGSNRAAWRRIDGSRSDNDKSRDFESGFAGSDSDVVTTTRKATGKYFKGGRNLQSTGEKQKAFAGFVPETKYKSKVGKTGVVDPNTGEFMAKPVSGGRSAVDRPEDADTFALEAADYYGTSAGTFPVDAEGNNVYSINYSVWQKLKEPGFDGNGQPIVNQQGNPIRAVERYSNAVKIIGGNERYDKFREDIIKDVQSINDPETDLGEAAKIKEGLKQKIAQKALRYTEKNMRPVLRGGKALCTVEADPRLLAEASLILRDTFAEELGDVFSPEDLLDQVFRPDAQTNERAKVFANNTNKDLDLLDRTNPQTVDFFVRKLDLPGLTPQGIQSEPGLALKARAIGMLDSLIGSDPDKAQAILGDPALLADGARKVVESLGEVRHSLQGVERGVGLDPQELVDAVVQRRKVRSEYNSLTQEQKAAQKAATATPNPDSLKRNAAYDASGTLFEEDYVSNVLIPQVERLAQQNPMDDRAIYEALMSDEGPTEGPLLPGKQVSGSKERVSPKMRAAAYLTSGVQTIGDLARVKNLGGSTEAAVSTAAPAITDAVLDFKKAVDWGLASDDPVIRRAAQSFITPGAPGAAHYSQFFKPYLARNLRLRAAIGEQGSPEKPPSLQISQDAAQVIMAQAVQAQRDPADLLDELIGQESSMSNAIWKLTGAGSDLGGMIGGGGDSATVHGGFGERESRSNGQILVNAWTERGADGSSSIGKLKDTIDGLNTVYNPSGRDTSESRTPVRLRFGMPVKEAQLLNPDPMELASIAGRMASDEGISWKKQNDDGEIVDATAPAVKRQGYGKEAYWNEVVKNTYQELANRKSTQRLNFAIDEGTLKTDDGRKVLSSSSEAEAIRSREIAAIDQKMTAWRNVGEYIQSNPEHLTRLVALGNSYAGGITGTGGAPRTPGEFEAFERQAGEMGLRQAFAPGADKAEHTGQYLLAFDPSKGKVRVSKDAPFQTALTYDTLLDTVNTGPVENAETGEQFQAEGDFTADSGAALENPENPVAPGSYLEKAQAEAAKLGKTLSPETLQMVQKADTERSEQEAGLAGMPKAFSTRIQDNPAFGAIKGMGGQRMAPGEAKDKRNEITLARLRDMVSQALFLKTPDEKFIREVNGKPVEGPELAIKRALTGRSNFRYEHP